jgi:uncharacterized protein
MNTDEAVAVWNDIVDFIQGLGTLSVAYSGGIDSRFLVHAAIHAGACVELLHASGPHVAPEDTRFALDWAASVGLEVRTLSFDPLALPEVAAGGRERCLACKRHLFEQIGSMAGGLVCDGSNASDARLHRPGSRALQELGVRSPLAERGLTKDMIRDLARRTGLARPDQQARACLLTRLPYGHVPDPEQLTRLAEGERRVEEMLVMAGQDEFPFRLRLCEGGRHELHLGREPASPLLLLGLTEILRAEGFDGAVVRIVPELSGYFDRLGNDAQI